MLADVADVPGLRKEAGASPGKPLVLPLLYKPTAEELSAAEKEANCQVRPSNKSSDLLIVIDDTMQSRKKGVAAICETLTRGHARAVSDGRHGGLGAHSVLGGWRSLADVGAGPGLAAS